MGTSVFQIRERDLLLPLPWGVGAATIRLFQVCVNCRVKRFRSFWNRLFHYNFRLKKQTLHFLSLCLILLLSASCSPTASTPSPAQLIQQAVAATLAAIPVPTQPPLPTPYPSPTAFNLAGLFCEYQFCI